MTGLGYKDFANGAVADASEADGYFMQQTVMRFANAAARDSALGVVLADGMCAYVADVDAVGVYDGIDWQRLDLNMRSYTPALSSNGTQPTTSTAQGGFRYVGGKSVQFWARLVIATAGTGIYEITLPATAARIYTPGICGHFMDATGPTPFPMNAVPFSTTEFRMAHSGGFWSQTSPVTVAVGDEIVVGGVYETLGAGW